MNYIATVAHLIKDITILECAMACAILYYKGKKLITALGARK